MSPTDSVEPDIAELTTSGRISGAPHRIEIWFAMGEQQVFLLADEGDRSDWARNLMISPEVVIEIGDRKRYSRARIIEAGSEEDAVARSLVVEKYSSRGHEDLADWGKTAMAIGIAWPD